MHELGEVDLECNSNEVSLELPTDISIRLDRVNDGYTVGLLKESCHCISIHSSCPWNRIVYGHEEGRRTLWHDEVLRVRVVFDHRNLNICKIEFM